MEVTLNAYSLQFKIHALLGDTFSVNKEECPMSIQVQYRSCFPWIGFIVAALLTIPNVATAETYRWGNVAMGGGGFVSGIVTSPNQANLIYARTDVGGAYRWNEASKSWIPLLDFINEQEKGFLGVEAIAIDPQAPSKVYMLVGTEYYNNGKTAILRSNDYGATWNKTEVTNQFTTHGNGKGRQNGERLVVDPHNGSILFCGTRKNGLFKSVDGGVTWVAVTSFPVTTTGNGNGISFVAFGAEGSAGTATQTIFVGVSRLNAANVYQSVDGGKTWKDISPTNAYMPQRGIVSTDGKLYLAEGNGCGPGAGAAGEPMDAGAIYQFNITAGTWKNISPAGVNNPYGGISVDAANPKHLVASTINRWMNQPWGNGDRIFVSEDGGASWVDLIGKSLVQMNENGISWIKGHALHWAGSINIDPFNPKRVFVTSGNGIFMTDNLSSTAASIWKFTVKGLEETVPDDAASLDNGTLVSVIGDYDGWVHPDITISPLAGTHKPNMGTTTGLAVAALQQQKMARVGSVLYGTVNGGATWTSIPRPAGIAATDVKGKLAYAADGSSLLWNPEGGATTYRTTNGGASWQTVTGLNVNTIPTADSKNAQKFYAFDGGSGNFYMSNDNGVNFAKTVTLNGGAKLIRSVPGREGDIWVPLNGAGLTRSTNSGAAFTKIADVIRCESVGFGKAAPGKAFPAVYIWGTVGAATGIFRSDDEGANWVRVNDDLHQFGGPGNAHFVIGDMAVYGRVFMSTVGRGIVYGDPAGTTPPSSSSSSSEIISSSSSLPLSAMSSSSSSSWQGPVANLRVQPNPILQQGDLYFNWIGKAAPSNISFTVMDARGMVVRTFDAQNLVSGANQVWVKDSHQLPSGNYIVKMLQAGKVLASAVFSKR